MKTGRPRTLPRGTFTRSWRVTADEVDAINRLLRRMRAEAEEADFYLRRMRADLRLPPITPMPITPLARPKASGRK